MIRLGTYSTAFSLPIAAIDEHGVKQRGPVPKTIDAIEDELARCAVEKISDRPAKESRFARMAA